MKCDIIAFVMRLWMCSGWYLTLGLICISRCPHIPTQEAGNLPILAQKKKKKTQITDDSFFAFAPCNICNLESVQSLSPSSFKEDALIVDNHKAGNTAQTNQGIKRPENVMDILVCRHMQEKFITSAGIYGRGSMMLRLLMDRWKVHTWRVRTFGMLCLIRSLWSSLLLQLDFV